MPLYQPPVYSHALVVIVLAPTALLHYQPGVNAPGIFTASERALKARLNQERCFNPTHNVRRTRRRVCAGATAGWRDNSRRGLLDESRFQRGLSACVTWGVAPGSYECRAVGAKTDISTTNWYSPFSRHLRILSLPYHSKMSPSSTVRTQPLQGDGHFF